MLAIKTIKGINLITIFGTYKAVRDMGIKIEELEFFDQKMQLAVDEFLRYKARMSDEELKNYYDIEVKLWNRNINVPRAVRKFREFSERRELNS